MTMAVLLRLSTLHLRQNAKRCTRLMCSQTVDKVHTKSENNCSQHFDVIIAGGGLVGSALACALTKNKVLREKKILLLDGGAELKKFDEGQYRNRVSAINQKSIELFKSIDVWERISQSRFKSVCEMHVWDACSDAKITFTNNNFSNEIACIIENDLILDAIICQLEKEPNVVRRYKSKIDSVNLASDKSQVTLEGGESLSCELLVGADGGNSIVRKEMRVDVFNLDYDKMAVVATLQIDDLGDNSVAWQRFIPTGPVALLPLNDTMSSLVWSTSKSHAKELVSMESEQFVGALNEAFLKEYPKSEMVTNLMQCVNTLMRKKDAACTMRQYPPKIFSVLDNSRACFPLGFLHASSYVSHGAALVGDAAHRIHPLAGQGVNLGFSDVQFLTNALSEATYAGAKLNNRQYLLQYEQKSLVNNIPLMLGVHGLHTLYSTTLSPIVLLRSLGLQVTQNVPQIKNFFMKRAMG